MKFILQSKNDILHVLREIKKFSKTYPAVVIEALKDNKVKFYTQGIGVDKVVSFELALNVFLKGKCNIYIDELINKINKAKKNESILFNLKDDKLELTFNNFTQIISTRKFEDFESIEINKLTDKKLLFSTYSVNLSASFNRFKSAIDLEDSRQTLHGIKFDTISGIFLRFTATNGKVLLISKFGECKADVCGNFSGIISLEAIEHYLKIFKSCEEIKFYLATYLDQYYYIFESKSATLMFRQISGEFPDTDSVLEDIKENAQSEIILNVIEFKTALDNLFGKNLRDILKISIDKNIMQLSLENSSDMTLATQNIRIINHNNLKVEKMAFSVEMINIVKQALTGYWLDFYVKDRVSGIYLTNQSLEMALMPLRR
ncbi:hypothetical protein AAEX28_04865 [Lentisphaerota bacterium WC36G]|nr:hypothetical protein LJT99_07245 [Lentisphaerae bacterium WC36]UDQ99420.1 hypothetical protein LJT99_07725 [Lentisphaerae bacterium WC36]